MTRDLEPLLTEAASDLESGGLLRLVRLPAREGELFEVDPPFKYQIRSRLKAMGASGLWSHQVEAIEHIRAARNTIISTGTASGKSLAFNLPVIEAILEDPSTRALYLYPTKALAQDQLRAIRAFGFPRVTAATYDGDTPADERTSVRKFARVVLSNPDMLHFGILPQHSRWAEFFRGLKFVVVDEAHVLRGIFGSHVGCILRRLLRIARHYRSDPVFVLASATIANPSHLAERLVGLPFVEVTKDGAPRGEKLMAFWNPPFIDEQAGTRGSANWEAARLLSRFVSAEVRTLAFAKSRKSAELVAKYGRQLAGAEFQDRIRPYRAGYLASHRREIERGLFGGELLGVAATTALELGIDVGGLDAVIMNGFPGTVAAMWQQSGRAGRSGEQSVAVLIGQDDPLDQYYISHPDVLLSRPFEEALVDTTNPNILEPHLGSAAYELPLEVDSVEGLFGQGANEVAERMIDEQKLHARKVKGVARLHWKRREPPGRDLDIRSLGGGTYSIVERDTGALLGTVDAARAFHQVHAGAIYLHQGDNYLVEQLDLVEQVALVTPSSVDYYTQARETSDIRILDVIAKKKLNTINFYVGKVDVTEHVVAYVKRSIASGETLEIVDLALPPQSLVTVAVWYEVESEVIGRARISESQLPGSLHAAEHAAIGILPMFAMADRWDIGGVSTALHQQTMMPTVFIYDGYPGGVGIAQRGYDQAEEHLRATLEAISQCPCESGCPACVQSPKCGNGNEPLDKHGAIRLLRELLSASANVARRAAR